jgi:hypothetical protein
MITRVQYEALRHGRFADTEWQDLRRIAIKLRKIGISAGEDDIYLLMSPSLIMELFNIYRKMADDSPNKSTEREQNKERAEFFWTAYEHWVEAIKKIGRA